MWLVWVPSLGHLKSSRLNNNLASHFISLFSKSAALFIQPMAGSVNITTWPSSNTHIDTGLSKTLEKQRQHKLTHELTIDKRERNKSLISLKSYEQRKADGGWERKLSPNYLEASQSEQAHLQLAEEKRGIEWKEEEEQQRVREQHAQTQSRKTGIREDRDEQDRQELD